MSQPFDEVVNILKFKAAHKQVQIAIEFSNLESTSLIRSDKRRLMQVILNLVSNALKFTPKNGRIDIRMRLIRRSEEPHPKLNEFCQRGEMLQVCVTDTGTGIQEKDMDNLFKLYGRI